jgi:hypothetical protein
VVAVVHRVTQTVMDLQEVVVVVQQQEVSEISAV